MRLERNSEKMVKLGATAATLYTLTECVIVYVLIINWLVNACRICNQRVGNCSYKASASNSYQPVKVVTVMGLGH